MAFADIELRDNGGGSFDISFGEAIVVILRTALRKLMGVGR